MFLQYPLVYSQKLYDIINAGIVESKYLVTFTVKNTPRLTKIY